MFSRLEWMIAGRYLRARRKEGAISAIAWFSLIGIMLGVGTLIVVMAVMNGFRAELVKQIVGAQPHILVQGQSGEGLSDYEALTDRIREAPGVVRAAPRMEQTVMATAFSNATGVVLRGLTLEDMRELPGLAAPELVYGSLEDVETGIALGTGVARKLGVVVGDKVTLTTPPNKVTAFGRVPTRRTYTVAYIFQMGWFQYDNAFVFLPLDDAQGLLNRRGRVDGIEVAVENPDSLQRYDYGIAGHIDETSISVTKRLVPGTSISNWKDQNGNFLNALDAERASMFVILTLIILVAALNIISGLIMLVKEKGQNIGIMRTFGMTRGAVLRVFFICGSSIGVVGTILGVIAGLLFIAYIHEIQTFLEWMLGISLWPADVRGLSTIPTQLVWSDVYATVAVALSLSLLATWYPARRAARLDPVEALRYE